MNEPAQKMAEHQLNKLPVGKHAEAWMWKKTNISHVTHNIRGLILTLLVKCYNQRLRFSRERCCFEQSAQARAQACARNVCGDVRRPPVDNRYNPANEPSSQILCSAPRCSAANCLPPGRLQPGHRQPDGAPSQPCQSRYRPANPQRISHPVPTFLYTRPARRCGERCADRSGLIPG